MHLTFSLLMPKVNLQRTVPLVTQLVVETKLVGPGKRILTSRTGFFFGSNHPHPYPPAELLLGPARGRPAGGNTQQDVEVSVCVCFFLVCVCIKCIRVWS